MNKYKKEEKMVGGYIYSERYGNRGGVMWINNKDGILFQFWFGLFDKVK